MSKGAFLTPLFIFGSTHSGVGKSSIVANWSVFLSAEGKKIALLDFNAAFPWQLRCAFPKSVQIEELSDLSELTGTNWNKFQKKLNPSSSKNLFFFPCGLVKSPETIFSEVGLKGFLIYLSSNFDYIFVNLSPGLKALSDARKIFQTKRGKSEFRCLGVLFSGNDSKSVINIDQLVRKNPLYSHLVSENLLTVFNKSSEEVEESTIIEKTFPVSEIKKVLNIRFPFQIPFLNDLKEQASVFEPIVLNDPSSLRQIISAFNRKVIEVLENIDLESPEESGGFFEPIWEEERYQLFLPVINRLKEVLSLNLLIRKNCINHFVEELGQDLRVILRVGQNPRPSFKFLFPGQLKIDLHKIKPSALYEVFDQYFSPLSKLKWKKNLGEMNINVEPVFEFSPDVNVFSTWNSLFEININNFERIKRVFTKFSEDLSIFEIPSLNQTLGYNSNNERKVEFFKSGKSPGISDGSLLVGGVVGFEPKFSFSLEYPTIYKIKKWAKSVFPEFKNILLELGKNFFVPRNLESDELGKKRIVFFKEILSENLTSLLPFPKYKLEFFRNSKFIALIKKVFVFSQPLFDSVLVFSNKFLNEKSNRIQSERKIIDFPNDSNFIVPLNQFICKEFLKPPKLQSKFNVIFDEKSVRSWVSRKSNSEKIPEFFDKSILTNKSFQVSEYLNVIGGSEEEDFCYKIPSIKEKKYKKTDVWNASKILRDKEEIKNFQYFEKRKEINDKNTFSESRFEICGKFISERGDEKDLRKTSVFIRIKREPSFLFKVFSEKFAYIDNISIANLPQKIETFKAPVKHKIIFQKNASSRLLEASISGLDSRNFPSEEIFQLFEKDFLIKHHFISEKIFSAPKNEDLVASKRYGIKAFFKVPEKELEGNLAEESSPEFFEFFAKKVAFAVETSRIRKKTFNFCAEKTSRKLEETEFCIDHKLKLGTFSFSKDVNPLKNTKSEFNSRKVFFPPSFSLYGFFSSEEWFHDFFTNWDFFLSDDSERLKKEKNSSILENGIPPKFAFSSFSEKIDFQTRNFLFFLDNSSKQKFRDFNLPPSYFNNCSPEFLGCWDSMGNFLYSDLASFFKRFFTRIKYSRRLQMFKRSLRYFLVFSFVSKNMQPNSKFSEKRFAMPKRLKCIPPKRIEIKKLGIRDLLNAGLEVKEKMIDHLNRLLK
ncbi:MAG: hypothetical protein HQM08_03105 [Candidatus Riflebacteria bacterium]|nr:hypothetical protein [Candidatus Riflebacteria bacterium]